MSNNTRINVIGAGLAGSEAAWQIAERGVKVDLYEMKPDKKSPAHHEDSFAELVCSNSLRSDQLENAVGLLKEELRQLNSLIMMCADNNRVPAGGALAVDRKGFSEDVTKRILNHPNINIINREVVLLSELSKENDITVIATGPLTSDSLSEEIARLTGDEHLYFYDAAAPIVQLDTIDMDIAYKAARYDKGTADYINCPMDREQYESFREELINAELAPLKEFENLKVFEGCMPIEEMARRGIDTMRFGPLKPVGLADPRTGKEAYAVVQLRQDNMEGTLFNIVGFQTHLKWGEQKRVFSMIPGLSNAEFLRYGVMHRNTYINSPKLLDATYNLKSDKHIYFAGQITGVEGYIESTASGFVAGVNAVRQAHSLNRIIFPSTTAIGGLSSYVSSYVGGNFQPMNVNFGIIDSLGKKIRNKKEKNTLLAERALNHIQDIVNTLK